MAQTPKSPLVLIPSGANDGIASPSFMRDTFPFIRQASITLGICIVLSIGLIVGSRFILSGQEQKKALAQSELAVAQGKYTAATDEKNEINAYQNKYIELVKHGFVAAENRLDVIETIHQIQERHKFLPIAYEILPQQAMQLDPSVIASELELRASRIDIHMGLLHEVDLLTFLNELRSTGVFSPQTCSIKAADIVRETELSAHLQAECTVYWITMGRSAANNPDAPVAAP